MTDLNRYLLRRLLPTVLLLLYPFVGVQGQAYGTEQGVAEFHSSVPLHTFIGTSDRLTGRVNLADSTVDFYLDLHTLDTGIEKRDRDMLETLEAEQYPFAEFFGTLSTPFDPEEEGKQQVSAAGTFTIHGVSREITVDGTLERVPEGLRLIASWTLNMTDYDIKPPGILFYRVSEEIDIEIDAMLKPEQE